MCQEMLPLPLYSRTLIPVRADVNCHAALLRDHHAHGWADVSSQVYAYLASMHSQGAIEVLAVCALYRLLVRPLANLRSEMHSLRRRAKSREP